MLISQLAFIHIVLHIFCVIFAFWVIGSLNVDSWFRKGDTGRIRLFFILLAILLGSALSNFIMDFFRLVQEASLMFG
ncbi:DUF1146 family protein [Salinicoccus halodurans]|uniref:Membrane protein n=1 Tax=Salinicoccus halodurans TaxID=407035 RepID=A0A0F7HNL5_9STAP|nr:DUF1146 family protein [Salinicoccus halodurans]AKG74786.1 membrane protein [Salinicoccus halodurans]SFK70317.1 conserved hypothetical integral membrane protein [Salinicoccus halodurans]